MTRRTLVARAGLGLTLLSLAGLGGAATAQAFRQVAVLVGRVDDAATRASVPDVEVRVAGSSLVARTGEDGRFRVVGLPAGRHVATFRRLGYVDDRDGARR